jgi:hypothetical protein
MTPGFNWLPSESSSSEDDRRYVMVDGRESIAKGINPYPEMIEWLETRNIDSHSWTTFPLWDGRNTLGFFFEEAVPLETVMLFKLTFG